jgi:hypothetical protein
VVEAAFGVDVEEDAAAAGERGAGSSVAPHGAAHDRGGRLELARGLLRRMEDRSDHVRAQPAPGEDGRLLPVAGALAGLLPGGGLRRGSTVGVAGGPGAGSLVFALIAEASAAGSWAGVVGRPDLGVVAAVEAGVRPDRLALVPDPGAYLVAVTSALLDGLDLVVVAGVERAGVRAADRQRLAAKARQRGAVLLALGSWPGADVQLRCAGVRWEGPEAGAGRLRSRRVEVRVHGRGTGSGRSAELLLPGPDGTVAAAPGRAVPDPVSRPRPVAAVAG